MQIAIVYSKPSARILSTPFGATDDDTEVIASAVATGLKAKGIETAIYPISEETIPTIADIRADCIFNLIEWCGLDIGLAQKAFHYLRQLDIPVTGSSEALYVLTGDKIAMKKALIARGIPVPVGVAFETGQEPIPDDLPYPVLVKPSTEHCSLGLGYDTIAYSEEELRPIIRKQIKAFEQPALVEEFVDGREFEIYLLEEKGVVRVLPIEEVIFYGKQKLPFQTYAAKWEEKSKEYQNTGVDIAKLNKSDRQKIEKVCRDAFRKMGFYGYARFDMRFRDGKPYILETNVNPSVYDDVEELRDPNEEVIWGIKFSDYLYAIVESAFYHHARGDKI